MDGYEASRQIRGMEGMADIPIIAMTANAMSGDREKALEAGMNDHIPKPIEPSHLIESLVKWGMKEDSMADNSPKPVADENLDETGSVSESLTGIEFIDNAGIINEAVQWSSTDSFIQYLEGFDTMEGLRRSGWNHDLYKKLLKKFRAEYLNSADTLKTAFDSGNIEYAERLVHTVKGISGNLGASGLYDAAVNLDSAIVRENALPDEMFDVFRKELASVMEAIGCIETADADDDSLRKPKGSYDFLYGVLEKIEKPLSEFKPFGLARDLDSVLEMEWDGDISVMIDEFAGHLKKYQLKEALASLVRLKNRVKEMRHETEND
jgi:CheY-like chemotaxis protein